MFNKPSEGFSSRPESRLNALSSPVVSYISSLVNSAVLAVAISSLPSSATAQDFKHLDGEEVVLPDGYTYDRRDFEFGYRLYLDAFCSDIFPLIGKNNIVEFGHEEHEEHEEYEEHVEGSGLPPEGCHYHGAELHCEGEHHVEDENSHTQHSDNEEHAAHSTCADIHGEFALAQQLHVVRGQDGYLQADSDPVANIHLGLFEIPLVVFPGGSVLKMGPHFGGHVLFEDTWEFHIGIGGDLTFDRANVVFEWAPQHLVQTGFRTEEALVVSNYEVIENRFTAGLGYFYSANHPGYDTDGIEIPDVNFHFLRATTGFRISRKVCFEIDGNLALNTLFQPDGQVPSVGAGLFLTNCTHLFDIH